MGTLVIEHLPEQSTEVQALKMPAVKIQAIPVDIEQREVIGTALVHLAVEHHTVGSGDIGAVGPQRKELLKASLGIACDPLGHDPALEFDPQRNPTCRQRCHAGDQT
jgi:hypothetical protein